MAPVHQEGCGGRDALRSALAVLKEVRTTRAVLPPASSQAWAAVPVPWTSQTRHSATFGVSVPPRGPGFSTLPSRSFARSDHARGFQTVATLDSAVSSTPPMTVSQARDILRRVGSTPLKLPRCVSSSSALSRTASSSWSIPRSSQPSTQSCSSARSTTLSVPSRPTQRPGSVEVSEDPFQLEDKNGAVSNNSMPAEAVNIALCSVSASTLAKYKLMFTRFQKFATAKGVNILEYSFTKVLFIGFLLSIYKSKGSIGSLLMAKIQLLNLLLRTASSFQNSLKA